MILSSQIHRMSSKSPLNGHWDNIFPWINLAIKWNHVISPNMWPYVEYVKWNKWKFRRKWKGIQYIIYTFVPIHTPNLIQRKEGRNEKSIHFFLCLSCWKSRRIFFLNFSVFFIRNQTYTSNVCGGRIFHCAYIRNKCLAQCYPNTHTVFFPSTVGVVATSPHFHFLYNHFYFLCFLFISFFFFPFYFMYIKSFFGLYKKQSFFWTFEFFVGLSRCWCVYRDGGWHGSDGLPENYDFDWWASYPWCFVLKFW